MTHADKQQQRSAANVIGGKTARACDSCLRRRARWYCAADDAFLCQACDASVHSANPLARRHERLRLKTSSSSSSTAFLNSDELSPPWLHGFRRKARTPRPHHNAKMAKMVDDSPKVWTLVPDLETSTDESKEEEEEEQLLYRVPIFDPVLAEFCSPPPLDDANPCAEEVKPAVQLPISHSDGLAGFLPSDIDIDFAEFAADMETLLGQGLDEGSVGIEGLGLMDSPEGNLYESLGEGGAVKVEINDDEVAAGNLEVDIDLSRETMEFNFDCESPTTGEEEEEKVSVTENGYKEEATAAAEERTVMLKLDYEAVITTWSSQGTSPWTNGERPQFSLDECWPNYTGTWGGGGGEMHGMYGDQVGGNLGEREARVTRYREKRRTRLFSKKIRYEVRKLNAEKRPRMKGRFVKRASFSGATAATPVFPY